MKIDKSIFKPYDIRGVYPNQINEYTAKLIGRAVTELLNPKQAVLVKDVRIGSDKIYQSLIGGLLEGGCNVDYLGESTTDMMYFAVGKYAYDLGISVTGSHNPPNYTGIKIVTKGVIPVSGDSGIFDIQEKAAAGRFKEVSTKGSYKEVNLRKDYTNHVLSFIDSLRIKPLTLCVDIGNGAVGDAAQDVLSKLPVKVHYLFKEKDGSFPNHLPDPSKEENVRSLKKKVLETRSDLGAAFDGDGDRVFFIDEKGDYTIGYFLTCLFSRILLKKNPGEKVIYDSRFNWAIIDTVKKFGGVPLLNKVGHAFIKERMRSENALFAGESSSHFYFRKNFFADNGIIPLLLLLELISSEGKTLSQLLSYYRKNYIWAGEFSTEVKDADIVMDKIKAIYSNYKVDETDGISIDNDREWRFNVRKSNTEPLIRLCVEGKNQELVNRVVKEVSKIIK